MSIKDINNSPEARKNWIEMFKNVDEKYYAENPESLIPSFENELRRLGFDFEISNQAFGLMPKNKEKILPIVIKYYELAKEQHKINEQNHFMGFFQFKGIEEIVPMLLEDFHSKTTENLTRWIISDCLYQIRSKRYIKEYIEIASNPIFGPNRQMIILLLGKLKEESAIPTLISLLEDETVRLQVIIALGEFKGEEFRCYFERFKDSNHPGWRKYSRAALRKLDN